LVTEKNKFTQHIEHARCEGCYHFKGGVEWSLEGPMVERGGDNIKERGKKKICGRETVHTDENFSWVFYLQ